MIVSFTNEQNFYISSQRGLDDRGYFQTVLIFFFRRTAFMYRNIGKCQNFTFKSNGFFFLEDNGLQLDKSYFKILGRYGG